MSRDGSRGEIPSGPLPPLRAAAAIVVRRGRGGSWVLVDRRPAGGHLAGFWEFPGGKLSSGETAEACAVREVFEETGVSIEVEERILSQVWRYPEREVRIEFFLGRYLAGIPGPWGCRAVRWVRPERLDCYAFPPANDAVLAILGRRTWSA